MIALAWYELAALVALVALAALTAGGVLPEKYRSAVWVAVGFLASVVTLGAARRFFRKPATAELELPEAGTVGATAPLESNSDELEHNLEGKEDAIIHEHDKPLDPGDYPGDEPGDLATLDKWATEGRE